MRKLRQRQTSPKGNMLALVVSVTALILIILFFLLGYVQLLNSHEGHKTALESATLAAAQEMSKIVVETEHFGFVALSDHPPVGDATKAQDGEPLPVLGINTLLSTVRLDWIIANQLNNQVMKRLALTDIAEAKKAAVQLEKTLRDAVEVQASVKDLNGNEVNIYKRAKEHYEANLLNTTRQGRPVLNSFRMTLGWLEKGSTTITSIPQPERLSEVSKDQQLAGKYKSFVNIPAFSQDFYFCGVGTNASLVSLKDFRPADGARICSVLKIEADYKIDTYDGSSGGQKVRIVHSAVCAQPPANPDLYPPAHLSVTFPAGKVPRISTIRDIVEDQDMRTRIMPMYLPIGNDWPGAGSTLVSTPMPGGGGPTGTVSGALSMGIHDWLRSSRNRVRIDEVLRIMDVDLMTVPGATSLSPNYITYTFDACPGDPNDPRLVALSNGTVDAQNSYLLMTMLADVKNSIPMNSTALGGNGSTVQSTNGNQFGSTELDNFWKFLADSNKNAWQTRAQADAVLADPSIASNPQWTANANQAKRNAEWTIYMSEWLAEHLKDMTLLGIKQTSNTNGGGLRNEFELGSDIYVDASGNWSTSGPSVNKLIYNKQFAATAAGIKASAGLTSAAQNNAGETSGDIQGVSWVHAPGTPSNFYFFLADDGRALSIAGSGSAIFASTAGAGVGSAMASILPSGTPPAAAGGKIFRFHIQPDGNILITYAMTPFANIPVSENQIYGVSTNAMTTGTDLPVTWTAVLRDQVRTWGRPLGGRHAGQPSTGSPVDYVNNPAFGGAAGMSPLSYSGGQIMLGGTPLTPQPRRNYMSGGLAVEFQIRTPLILKCNEVVETTSNGGTNTPLLPKIPPWLL